MTWIKTTAVAAAAAAAAAAAPACRWADEEIALDLVEYRTESVVIGRRPAVL